MEVNDDGFLPSFEEARLIFTAFTYTEVNNCLSIYHEDTKTGLLLSVYGENCRMRYLRCFISFLFFLFLARLDSESLEGRNMPGSN